MEDRNFKVNARDGDLQSCTVYCRGDLLDQVCGAFLEKGYRVIYIEEV